MSEIKIQDEIEYHFTVNGEVVALVWGTKLSCWETVAYVKNRDGEIVASALHNTTVYTSEISETGEIVKHQVWPVPGRKGAQ